MSEFKTDDPTRIDKLALEVIKERELQEMSRDCIYTRKDLEIADENQQLKNEILKLKEEISILNSDKKDLENLIIKLNMRMYLDY